ncbi:MAG: flagellar hook-basal body protein [Limnochordia bacterium]
MRGLYSGALGMLAGMEKIHTVSHNLANAGTTGFKRLDGTFRSFSEQLLRHERRSLDGRLESTPIGRLGVATQIDATYLQWGAGPLRETGSELHAAIARDGFFVVETAGGEAYTRDGRFLIDRDGWLVTLEGRRVLGSEGPLSAAGAQVHLGTGGELISDGELIGALRFVEFADPSALEPLGGGLYRPTEGSGAPTQCEEHLATGFVEESNVNVVTEMVELIAATRAYEANQRVIVAYDDTLGKAVNELARV